MLKDQKWENFLKEASNLIFFWIFAVILFSIHRGIFVALFRHEIGEQAAFADFANAFFTGFRFDCTVVSYFLLLPLVCTLVLSPFAKFGIIKKVRIWFQYIFVILACLTCIITLNYYKEFNDQFNNFLFLSLYDDKVAIAKTIVEYYNPVLNTLLLILTITAGIFIFRYFENKEFIYNRLKAIKPTKFNIVAVTVVLIVLYIGCFRGTFGRIPTTRRWAATSTNAFLNKTIMNP